MATETYLSKLSEVFEIYDDIDMKSVVRHNLGEGSISEQMSPLFDEYEVLRKQIEQYAVFVHDEAVAGMTELLRDINSILVEQSNQSDAKWMERSSGFVVKFEAILESTKKWIPHFVMAAIQQQGLLSDKGIRQEYEDAVTNLHFEIESAIAKVEVVTEAAIEKADSESEKIITRARRTATNISVLDAQNQFSEAQIDLHKGVRIWFLLSALFVVLFLFVINLFYSQSVVVSDGQLWAFVYKGILRLLTLSIVGVCFAFSLRMFRAHLHMSQLNKHRQRISNSIEAFVESASTQEQRDMILKMLVESVIAFGNSGILPGDEDTIGAQRFGVEQLPSMVRMGIGSSSSG